MDTNVNQNIRLIRERQNSVGQLGALRQSVSLLDAVAIIVCVVVGAGIFKAPSIVAANAGNGSLALVVFGGWRRHGFETLVEYMSPVFWLFFLLTGISVFVLRHKEPERPRPFRVPFYPLTPVLFCAVSAYMLWSCVAYTGLGALVGLAVLLLGLVVLWLANNFGKRFDPVE
jgi:amino acid transporter